VFRLRFAVAALLALLVAVQGGMALSSWQGPVMQTEAVAYEAPWAVLVIAAECGVVLLAAVLVRPLSQAQRSETEVRA
jgi:hypothetical protein